MTALRVVAVLSAMATVLAAPAAKSASSQAFIDWSTFEVQILDLGPGPAPTTDWLSQSQTVTAYAFTQGGTFPRESFSNAFWGTPLVASATTDHASAQAQIDLLPHQHEFLNVIASTAPSGGCPVRSACTNYASGQTARSATFSVSGPAAIAFKVDYSYSVTGASGNVDQAYVYLLMQASFSTPTGAAGNSSSVDSKTFNSFSDGSSAGFGTLYTGVIASGAGTGSFQLQLQTYAQSPVAAVPEPETWLALLAGLSAVAWMKRRRAARLICSNLA